MAVSFIDGGNRSTRRKPPTCRQSLTNLAGETYRQSLTNLVREWNSITTKIIITVIFFCLFLDNFITTLHWYENESIKRFPPNLGKSESLLTDTNTILGKRRKQNWCHKFSIKIVFEIYQCYSLKKNRQHNGQKEKKKDKRTTIIYKTLHRKL